MTPGGARESGELVLLSGDNVTLRRYLRREALTGPAHHQTDSGAADHTPVRNVASMSRTLLRRYVTTAAR